MNTTEGAAEAVKMLDVGSIWFTPPGAYSSKNCTVIACQSCGSETLVLKKHHAASYLCSPCVQANSYA